MCVVRSHTVLVREVPLQLFVFRKRLSLVRTLGPDMTVEGTEVLVSCKELISGKDERPLPRG